jgi:hypothetical protein
MTKAAQFLGYFGRLQKQYIISNKKCVGRLFLRTNQVTLAHTDPNLLENRLDAINSAEKKFLKTLRYDE